MKIISFIVLIILGVSIVALNLLVQNWLVERNTAKLETEILADGQREADARAEYDTYMANHGESDTVRCESGWLYIREREPSYVDSTMHIITAISKPLWQTTYGAPCTTRYNSSDKR